MDDGGICLIDSFRKDYLDPHGIGKGCYFLYSGSVYSHHDQSPKQGGFPFQQNDIIRMEVNVQQKQISWRNKAKNHVYTLDIQTTSDMYFCFNISGIDMIELI